jgi:DNA-binding GntR family transcriptional regulator
MASQPQNNARLFGNAAALDVKSLVDVVAEHIVAAMLAGELEQGARLGEERVARALGVSRGPVREAAALLLSRGLLVQHPRRGYFVRRFTVEEIEDLYDMRLAMERHALARVIAADNVRGLVCAMTLQMEVMSAAARKSDRPGIAQSDLAFHRLIVSHADNARLLKHFDDLALELLVLNGRLDMLRFAPKQLVASHKPLITALRQRNLARALKAIDLHIGDASATMTRHFSASVRSPK